MTATLNPYLSFRDSAREAMQFYADVLGGDLVVSTFGEAGAAEGADGDLVMHAQLSTPQGFTLMASDTPAGMDYEPPAGFAVSLSGDDPQLREWFEKLADGGTVRMPLEKQAWGDEFGMVADRFGTSWMVNIAAPEGSQA